MKFTLNSRASCLQMILSLMLLYAPIRVSLYVLPCSYMLTFLQDNTLLIAFATTSKQLRTVRALIEWNQQKVEKAIPAQLPVQPHIKIKHLAVTSWLHEGPGSPLNASHMESSMSQLSRLEFLPPCADANGRVTAPTIVTLRSHLPASPSHYNQDVFTTIDRWEVREKLQGIHPAFEQLNSRRNSNGPQPGVSSPSFIQSTV